MCAYVYTCLRVYVQYTHVCVHSIRVCEGVCTCAHVQFFGCPHHTYQTPVVHSNARPKHCRVVDELHGPIGLHARVEQGDSPAHVTSEVIVAVEKGGKSERREGACVLGLLQ